MNIGKRRRAVHSIMSMENYEYDEICKTYKYTDKQTSNYIQLTISNKWSLPINTDF